jgi:cyanophycinase
MRHGSLKSPIVAGLYLVLAHALPAAAPSLETAGKLVIAGGAISSSAKEVWEVMLAGRLGAKPIGILSTASEDPQATGVPFTAELNEKHGAGSAVFVPLSATNGKADDPVTVALIRSCGGFYFTGGQQERTVRALKRRDGSRTAALEAVWEVYGKGGVIGGSSAGAAIMSDPMITGGNSSDALLHGATPEGTPAGSRGVGYGAGLGFDPGVLYCQHHLERGRFGRLLAALVSDALAFQTGVGVAEDTAWVVDHAKQTGTVIGAAGVLHVDATRMERREGGGFGGVTLHYLDRGDSIHLKTGEITPASGKAEVTAPAETSAPAEVADAWSRNAIWQAVVELAKRGEGAAVVANDARFDLKFRRTAATRVWRQEVEAEGERPTWTMSCLAIEVSPRAPGATSGQSEKEARMPKGRGQFQIEARNKALNIFTYRPEGYSDGPLLVVMHGLNRNAADYRDNAMALGVRFKALIAAPEFTLEQFSTEAYQRGGVTRDGKAQPKEEWTFQYIADVVAAMRARSGRPDLSYYLIGHSAGGQFLSRMAAFLPGDAERIIAANPGTLIFPTRDRPFQFGFGQLPESLSEDARLKAYLAAPLTLYLGTADTGLKNLDVTPEAMLQGATRLERGRACFAMGEALARERGWPFNWRLVEAEGVAHDSKAIFAHPMAEKALFGR